MIGKMGYGAKIAAAVIIFFLSSMSVSYAGRDNLILKGIVRSLNSGSNVATIDVQSESCRGAQNFRFDSSAGLDTSMIGKSVTFKIDSSKCDNALTPKILKIISK
ncbi:MAG: hypothetical protein ABSB95_05830 [Dissulfurispiraceae bacterium]